MENLLKGINKFSSSFLFTVFLWAIVRFFTAVASCYIWLSVLGAPDLKLFSFIMCADFISGLLNVSFFLLFFFKRTRTLMKINSALFGTSILTIAGVAYVHISVYAQGYIGIGPLILCSLILVFHMVTFILSSRKIKLREDEEDDNEDVTEEE